MFSLGIFECWMLAQAFTARAIRQEQEQLKELDRQEINALYNK